MSMHFLETVSEFGFHFQRVARAYDLRSFRVALTESPRLAARTIPGGDLDVAAAWFQLVDSGRAQIGRATYTRVDQ